MDFPCRLCLVECSTNNLTSIFKCSLKHTEDSLVDILFWVFAVEVDVTDLYSKAICDDCIQLIEYVVEIRNTFQKTQQSLQGSFVGNRCEEFEVLSSEGSVNDKQTKPRSITPSTSSSKHNDKQTKPRSITPSTSSSKHSYCSSSPRIRVPLSTLETMCSLTVDLERFEHSQDFMRYRELGKGRFKKRKYRHFNLDDSLLEDICNTLDDKKLQKIEIVSTEKNSNIKETNVSTELCVSSINESCLLNPGNVLLEKMAVTANKNHEAYILEDIIDNRKNLTSSLPTPQIKKDSDWTRITSTKDIGTNTEPILSPETRSIGITVDVDMIEAGTLTKNFKQKKPKDTIRMKIQTLDKISPSISVWLEPVERLLGRENYKEIDDFCYVKMNNKEESEKDIKIEAITQVPQKKAESPIELRKQSKMSLCNYEENCRLCLKVDRPNASKNIFSHCLEACQDPLVQIIFSLFNVELHTHKSYPQLVCRKCLTELEHFLLFKEDLIRNQEFLLGLFRAAYPNYVEKNDPHLQLIEDSPKPVIPQPLNNFDAYISEEKKALVITNETYPQIPQATNEHSLEVTNRKRITRHTSKQLAKDLLLKTDENRNLPFENSPEIKTEIPTVDVRKSRPDVKNERIPTSISTDIVTPGTPQVSFLQNFNLITLKDANILKTQQAPLTRARILKKYKVPKIINPNSVNITKAKRKTIVQKRSRKKINKALDLIDKRSVNFLVRYGFRKFGNTRLRSGIQIVDGKQSLGPNSKIIDKSNNAVSKQNGCENVYKDVKLDKFSTYEKIDLVENKKNEEVQITCIPKSEVPSPIITNKSSPKKIEPIPSKCFYQPNNSPQGQKTCLNVENEVKSPSNPKKPTSIAKSKITNHNVDIESDQNVWSLNKSQASMSRRNGQKNLTVMQEKVPTKLRKTSSFDKSNTSRQPIGINKIKSENIELVSTKSTFSNELVNISPTPRICVATKRRRGGRKINLNLKIKRAKPFESKSFEEKYSISEAQQPFGAAAIEEERKGNLRSNSRSSNKDIDRLSLDCEKTTVKQECILDDIVEKNEIKQERDLRSSSRSSVHHSNESLFEPSTKKQNKSSPVKIKYSAANTPNRKLSPDKTCFNGLTTSLKVKTELVSAFQTLSDQYEIDDNIGLRMKLRKTLSPESMNSLKFDTQEVDELEGHHELLKFDVAPDFKVEKIEGLLDKSPKVRNVNVNENDEFHVTVTGIDAAPVDYIDLTKCSSICSGRQRQSTSGSKRKSRPPIKFSPSRFNPRPAICFYESNEIQNVTHKMFKLLRSASQKCLKFEDEKVTRRSPKANGSADKVEQKMTRKNLKVKR